ncbi:MAG: hypothetical protein HKN92_10455 [Chitinophagales bacterium]|nr:hypothetical protein [Chitinophagales bacterium]
MNTAVNKYENRRKTESKILVSRDMIEKVWENGRIINGHDPNRYRQDDCGAWIIRDRYGSKDSSYGWEIDKNPENKNGSSNSKLKPIQWENKEFKNIGMNNGMVKAVGPKNI